jgi:DNA polymerase elongation subunit (family B)
MDWVYDIETYPNCFTFTAICADNSRTQVYECSSRKNDVSQLFEFLDMLHDKKHRMVGFNNKGFDYPVLHALIEVRAKAVTVSGKAVAKKAYKVAQDIISVQAEHNNIRLKEYVKQVDLFKIHHFDNKARATSLKMIEFNMKSDSIEDLPFPVGTELTDSEIDVLLKYNMHDVVKTLDFYNISLNAIRFRDELSKKYKRDFTNHNDTKIGKDYFIMQLEKTMPDSCYKKDSTGKKVINQTKRPLIAIKDCLFSYYDFQRPEFQAIFEWFKKQTIAETKGVFSDITEDKLERVAMFADMNIMRKKFKAEQIDEELVAFKAAYPAGWIDKVELKAKKKGQPVYSYWYCWHEAETLNVMVDGFRFDFGTGGIHGSVSSCIVSESDTHQLIDADVSSMYPNIAIANRAYPEHLTDRFCDIYKDVYEQRKSYPKASAENAMLKLALNGVYGDSNNQYSPFYDPQYTMTITINGQLSLCLLAEKLLTIEGLSLVQVNTDGVTVLCPRNMMDKYNAICEAWQQQVGLQLEYASYSKMIIRDVNNYLAFYTDGKVKRKGAYQYEGLGWHQNQGGLVIPMAAEANMIYGTDIKDFVQNHKDMYNFMLRTKVPRNSKLMLVMDDGTEIQQQNICRYYACKDGGKLVKIMPALIEGGEDRRLSIDSSWNVKTCNNIKDFGNDIDYDYYIAEAEKLVVQ